MSLFDDLANKLMQDTLLLNEMPIKKLKGSEAYKYDPSHATYSAFSRKPTSLRSSAEGIDPYNEELQNKIVIKTVKKILDDLDSVGGESEAAAKDYQYKIAEFIRQSINELVPDSLKPSGKAYTAQDGYAARAILSALQEQGIVATERNKAKEDFDRVRETPDALKQAVKDVASAPEVKTAVANDIKSSVEEPEVPEEPKAPEVPEEPEELEEPETSEEPESEEPEEEEDEELEEEEEEEEPVKPEPKRSLSSFDGDKTYDITDKAETSDLTDMEQYALERLESGETGTKMMKKLASSLKLRNLPKQIPEILSSLVSKGVLAPEETEKISRNLNDREEDIARDLGISLPKEDPYTGSIE